MTYVLELPDAPYLTPNSRAHWAKRSRYGRTWRDTTALIARSHNIPHAGHVHVALVMRPRDRRRRDADNLVSGVLKHCIDGLVDAGIVPDDNPDHVTAAMPRIVPPPAGTSTAPAHRWEPPHHPVGRAVTPLFFRCTTCSSTEVTGDA